MTAARALAWILLLGSVALGTGTTREARPPQTAGAFMVLAADFHVHSFPGDGLLLPWDAADEARRRGLDVIALTNHNSTWSWQLAERVSPDPRGVMMLPGVELTAPGYHMIAIGIQSPVSWRQPPRGAVAVIHDLGGVAIAAHPLAPRPSRWDDTAIDAIDGFEAGSSNDTLADIAEFTRRVVVRRPSIAVIGASDFHHFAPLGLCRTFLFVTERSPAGVLDAVRRGRTVACDGRGETSGPAELAASVSAECRRIAAGSGETSWRDLLSTYGAWLAMLALVMLGAREGN